MIIKGTCLRFLVALLLIASGLSLPVYAQEINPVTEGTVSYITGESVYVKFESTLGIENGDTLFSINKNGIPEPALIVRHHSSVSCLCNAIGANTFKVSDKVAARKRTVTISESSEYKPEDKVEKDVHEQVLTSKVKETGNGSRNQDFNARLSLSSYSSFSGSASENFHRLRYSFSMYASNISGSKFSNETYILFGQKLNQWNLVKENIKDALKIYSLALKYDFNKSASIWAGRKINPNIANAGAVDGLQFEYNRNGLIAGVVVGSHPDYEDYSFNFSLPEYGAYIGQNHKVKNGMVQTSLAFFEQRNKTNIDRRFAYFQHTSSLIKNINIFSSFEIDLYKMEAGVPSNSLSLTSLYLSANYRISRCLSFFGSYDSRKNVIYYETFKNYADALLQQATRQGLRFRINYLPANFLNIGLNAGTRSQKGDPQPTNTLNGYASFSDIPVIRSSLTLSADMMKTSYLNGQFYEARLAKDIIPGKIYSMLRYQYANFNYLISKSLLVQNIGEIDFSYQISKKLFMSVNFEATFQKDGNYNRLYLNLRKKF